MRAGLTVSIIGHVALLGFGFIAFPDALPLKVEDIEALPVDLVSVADATDLLKGDEHSKIAPKEKPQPVAEIPAKIPAPKPIPKPAERPVEAAAPPPPPPPPPEPAEIPQPPEPPAPPEEDIASLIEPQPAETAPEPIPAPPPDAPIPRHRPKPPPKPIAEPKPEPKPQEVAAEPPAPKQEFNTDTIAALLNKDEPAGGGTPTPAPEPQTIGSIEGHADAAMTQSEIAALKARLYRCWNPPVAVREAASLVVTVRINLNQDGSLSSAPEVVSTAFDPLTQLAAESAVRAVVQCAPFGDILQPEKYALWSQIDFVFDPREMLGG